MKSGHSLRSGIRFSVSSAIAEMGRAPLWSLPSPLRPAHGSIIAGLCFAALFNTSIALTWASLVLLYPLALSPATRRWYFRVTKQSFGCACVLISQLFAPTTFVVSGGQGVDTERWVERDASGRVNGLRLAERGVWVSQALLSRFYLRDQLQSSLGEHELRIRAAPRCSQALCSERVVWLRLTSRTHLQVSNHQTLCDWL